MYGKSANSVPGQSFRAVYLEYVIGWCLQRPFFREFSQRYFRAALSRDIYARCLRAVISGDVFASVIEAWLPGKGSRNCFLKVVSESAPRKTFHGNALGNCFRYELPQSVVRKCFRGMFFRRYFEKARRYYAESASEVWPEHYIGQYYR